MNKTNTIKKKHYAAVSVKFLIKEEDYWVFGFMSNEYILNLITVEYKNMHGSRWLLTTSIKYHNYE